MSYRNPNVENPQDQVYPPRYPQQQRPPYQSQGSQFQPRQGYEQRSSYPPKEPYASSPNQAPPNQQGGRFEGILQQIMDGQKRNNKEMYEKMDTLFSNLNTKYDAVATHVKKLETQVTQTMEAVKRQEAESKKSFCNSAAIEERFEDQVPEWMLSKPTVDCMIWPEENYPERESNRARKRRLFPKIIPKTDNSGKFVCLVSSKIGNCSIPTDFQIVEMRESSHRPLIFGTPFLSTVGAIFDFPNQRISFNKVNKGMFFPMCSTKNSFVDMVQEEKVTLKPPQEGETEETIKEDPIPKPKQLAKQARSKTKAPTPKPPKGSTKIEDEAKPRKKVRKPRSGRNMKLLFPEELIDENLEGFKEKVIYLYFTCFLYGFTMLFISRSNALCRTGRELASLGLLQDGSDPGGNGPRSTEIITSRPTRPCDPGSKGPRSTRIFANKKPTYAVLTILSPINLNRLVKT
ncbi:unnamed protein product [Microthlaspi erraticum]|uniref:Uncharacterized protein n=1 Tax=Microthlaspi erraticum TaxID=1685480 RepID=A0A6D2JGP7_9BRAS|nr:unnamed protein product [Microthlaspi erraticum]